MFEKGEGKEEIPFTELLTYLKTNGVDVNADNHILIKNHVNKFFQVQGDKIVLSPKQSSPKQEEPELDPDEDSDDFIEMLANQQLEKDK